MLTSRSLLAAISILAVACDPSVAAIGRCTGGSITPTASSLDVSVVVGPGATHPGARFCVRAENASGEWVERPTDDAGRVSLPIDPAAGPWDITAARPQHVVVSVLAVTGPLGGALYSEPTNAYPRSERTLTVHTLPGLEIRSLDATQLGGAPGSGTFSSYFEFYPGASPFQFLVTDASGRWTLSDPTPRADRDIDITIAAPSNPPPAATTHTIEVHPPDGEHFFAQGQRGFLMGGCSGSGCGAMFPAAVPQPASDDPSALEWTFAVPGAPFPIERAMLSVETLRSGESVTRNYTISLPIAQLPARLELISGTAGTSSGSGFRGPAFSAAPAQGQRYVGRYGRMRTPCACGAPPIVVEVWRVHSYASEPFATRSLPTLPARLVLSDIADFDATGEVWNEGFAQQVDGASPPWSARVREMLGGVYTDR